MSTKNYDEFRNLNDKIAELEGVIQSLNEELEKQSYKASYYEEEAKISQIKSAAYYDALVALIKEDDMIQDAWNQFIVFLKLRVPERIPGITETDMK